MKHSKKHIRYTHYHPNFSKIIWTVGITLSTLSLIGSYVVIGEEFLVRESSPAIIYSSTKISNPNGGLCKITKEDAINIIKSIDKDYNVIVTDDNYKINGKYYYVLHSNLIEETPIEINKSYNDIFHVNSEPFFRVHTSYSGKGSYSGYRYCVDKESGDLYIEYVEDNKDMNTLIKYSEYIENLRKLIKIFANNGIPLDTHLDVTIKDNIYTVHLFSIFFNEEMSFTETSGWYDFNVVTGKVKNLITEEIYF